MLGEKVVVFFGGKGRLDISFGAHSLVGTQLISVVEKLAAKFARHGLQRASANEKAISIVSFEAFKLLLYTPWVQEEWPLEVQKPMLLESRILRHTII